MNIYSYSPSLSQISLKNSFGKVVFQNLAKIEMTRNKNWFFGFHFETEQHLIFFFYRIVIFIARSYMCKFHCKILVGKWFSRGGFMEPPLGTNWSKSTLVTYVLRTFVATCLIYEHVFRSYFEELKVFA